MMFKKLPRLTTLDRDHTLIIKITGDLDLSLNFEIERLQVLEQAYYHQYIFDLAAVTVYRDSGLAWLMMFQRRANKQGAHVYLINLWPEITARCQSAGLDVVSVSLCSVNPLNQIAASPETELFKVTEYKHLSIAG